MKLQWHEEPPTNPGWYWVWPQNHHRAYVAELTIVFDEETKKVATITRIPSPHGNSDVMAIPDLIHRWAGPIDVPPELSL